MGEFSGVSGAELCMLPVCPFGNVFPVAVVTGNFRAPACWVTWYPCALPFDLKCTRFSNARLVRYRRTLPFLRVRQCVPL